MRAAAGLLHGPDLVVERAPVLGEGVGAGDHDVDLLGAGSHRGADLPDALGKGGEAGGNPVDTAATGMPEPSSASSAVST